MRYSNNIFKECAFLLFAFIQEINDNYNDNFYSYNKIKEFKNKIFKPIKYKEITTDLIQLSEVKSAYEAAINKINWINDDYSLSGLKEFISFLLCFEKTFFKNIIKINNKIINIDYSNNEYKFEYKVSRISSIEDFYNVKISITTTKIPNTVSFFTASTDEEYNKLFSKKDNEYIDIIKISIDNDKNITSFKLLSDNGIDFDKIEDEISFCQFRNDLKNILILTFDLIMDDFIVCETNKKFLYWKRELYKIDKLYFIDK